VKKTPKRRVNTRSKKRLRAPAKVNINISPLGTISNVKSFDSCTKLLCTPDSMTTHPDTIINTSMNMDSIMNPNTSMNTSLNIVRTPSKDTIDTRQPSKPHKIETVKKWRWKMGKYKGKWEEFRRKLAKRFIK